MLSNLFHLYKHVDIYYHCTYVLIFYMCIYTQIKKEMYLSCMSFFFKEEGHRFHGEEVCLFVKGSDIQHVETVPYRPR